MGNTKWFQDARFGLFIHWGLYTIPAKGEWYASIQKNNTKQSTDNIVCRPAFRYPYYNIKIR